MNADIKAKWLAALRSGKFQQGQEHLEQKTDDFGGKAHCCLGVLCVVYTRETGGDWHDFMTTDDQEITPRAIADWAGLPYRNPSICLDFDDGTSKHETLSGLNDGGKTFEEIANLIEEYL